MGKWVQLIRTENSSTDEEGGSEANEVTCGSAFISSHLPLSNSGTVGEFPGSAAQGKPGGLSSNGLSFHIHTYSFWRSDLGEC